ncbi:MAG TPA: hypothetical protein VMU69_10470 [Bradyrhizobium sp.]|nr:hypothetical protein [Bradyrhizobium sp.]
MSTRAFTTTEFEGAGRLNPMPYGVRFPHRTEQSGGLRVGALFGLSGLVQRLGRNALIGEPVSFPARSV